MEFHHFTKFLDIQLNSCENSVFCDETFVGDVMSGLKGFVVKFMFRMSQVYSFVVLIKFFHGPFLSLFRNMMVVEQLCLADEDSIPMSTECFTSILL